MHARAINIRRQCLLGDLGELIDKERLVGPLIARGGRARVCPRRSSVLSDRIVSSIRGRGQGWLCLVGDTTAHIYKTKRITSISVH
jgi:hypothetical protein